MNDQKPDGEPRAKERMHAEPTAEECRIRDDFNKVLQAVEQSPAVVIITDRNGIVEYVNPRFTEVTGYAKEEVLGRTPSLLKSGITRPEQYKRMWDTIESGNIWRGQFCNRKKDGSFYPESASIAPVKNGAGIITHFVAVIEDRSHQMRAEKAEADARANALRVEQLEKLVRWLERMSAGNPSTVTAGAYGITTLRETDPALFAELIARYADLLERYLAGKAMKVDYNITADLRALVDHLGLLKAAPRDLVELHMDALKRKSAGVSPARADAYVDEGRMMVLELMGYLASYYRSFCITTRKQSKQ